MPRKKRKVEVENPKNEGEVVIKALKDAALVAMKVHLAFNVPMASEVNGKLTMIEPQEMALILNSQKE
jgi:hypothetical protein